uniref:Uncharacterized protein n=1 Tax=Anopheles farauti TaxID=69004 RepID=A0A182Q9Y4_9DIPT
MEAVPIGEDQPEEQEENRQLVELETSGTVEETVASTDYIDSEKMDVTDGSMVQEEATPSGGPTRVKTPSPRPLSTNQNSDEEQTEADQTVELDSSPEKKPSEAGKKSTHAASLKSPASEIFSVDDEEEHEEEEEEDEELDEDEYDDEEDEIYVEEKEPAVLNDSTDEEEEDRPRSKMLDLSTDEYTDEDAMEERPKKEGGKD